MTTFKEAQIIIGIDPDLEKSGVAILGNDLQLKNLTFPETVELFRNEQDSIKKVVIEAGWENKKANFRVGGGHSRQVNEQIARRVGMNHATGILLAEIAQALGLAVLLVKLLNQNSMQNSLTRLLAGKVVQIKSSVTQAC